MSDIALDDGDSVERKYRDWIRDKLPEYEEIWSRFIGHDGNGNPLAATGLIAGIDSEERERFAQAHYTLLITLITIDEIKKDFSLSQGEVDSVDSYLRCQKELLCFLAHVGRARDMFKKMDSCLSLRGEIRKRFDDFYSERSAYLHGPVPAQAVEDGFLKMPRLGNACTGEVRWIDESLWTCRNKFNFQFVADYVADTTKELFSLTRGALADCLDQIKMLVGSHSLPKLQSPVLTGTSALSSMETTSLSSIGSYKVKVLGASSSMDISDSR